MNRPFAIQDILSLARTGRLDSTSDGASMVRGWPGLAAVLLVVGCLTLAACGDGSSSPPRTEGAGVQAQATAILDDAAPGGAGVPGGGFVAAGVAGSGGKISPHGVVFDAVGKPVSAFEFPNRLAMSTAVVAGDEFFAIGTRCDDVPNMNDVGELECKPGGEAGYVVDLDTSNVRPLGLPRSNDSGSAVPGSWQLYRVGSRALLVANRAGHYATPPVSETDLAPPSFLAWERIGAKWSPIDAPANVVCQAGDTVVEDTTTPAAGLKMTVGEATGPTGHVVPTLRVLDPDDAHWVTPSSGPELPVGSIGSSPVCSDGWVTFVAPLFEGEPNTSTMATVSFDIVHRTWTEVRSLDPGSAGLAPIAFAGAPYVLMRQTLGGSWSAFDPVTGAATTLVEQPPKNAVVVAASTSGLLVFDPGSKPPRLNQIPVQ